MAYLHFCKTVVTAKSRKFPCYLFLKKILDLLLLSVIIYKILLDNRLLKTVRKLKTRVQNEVHMQIFLGQKSFPFEGFNGKRPWYMARFSLQIAFCFLWTKKQNWTWDQGLLQAFFHASLHLWIGLPVIPTGSVFVKTVFALETVLVTGTRNLKALVKSHLQELIWMCGIYHQSCMSIQPCCGLQHWEFWSTYIYAKNGVYEFQCHKYTGCYSFKLWDIYLCIHLSSKSYKHY